MGPYCKFCDRRCFVHITYDWPKKIRQSYGRYGLAATCAKGQVFEKQRLGYCYNDYVVTLEIA